MKARSDAELLREYAEQGSEAAFGEIVARHTDLVYSATLRQVGSHDLARDIAQSVFTDLARKARSLVRNMKPDASLVGWLYQSTRYAALTLLRNERRRRARERQVMEQSDTISETPSDWDRVGPILDEAMADLSDTDREALLLRFFKNQDFRTVGAALGLSDDAAQKRVARGLEKLRADLSRRGIATSTIALSTAISVNSVQAAPTGLATSLASASLGSAAVETGTTLNLLELMAITKSQLGIIGAILMASLVTPLMLQHQAQGRLRAEDETFRQQEGRRAKLEAENQHLSNLLAQAQVSATPSNAELLRLRGEVARLRKEVQDLSQPRRATPRSRSDQLASIAQRYSERISRLKQYLEGNPSESIPELQFMTDKDWLWLAGEKTPDTPEGYQRAMSLARLTAEWTLMREIMRPALRQYASEHNGEFPHDLSELKPYFKSPVDDATLQRWHILHASKLPNLKQNLRQEDWVITQKAPVNAAIDQRIVFSLKDSHVFSDSPPEHWDTAP